MNIQLVIFALLSIFAISGAIVTVTHRNPVYCALGLIACFLAVAGFYLLLNAPFLAAVQVIIYAGSIMTLFIFTIMLMDLDKSHIESDPAKLGKYIAMLLGYVLFFQLVIVVNMGILSGKQGPWTAEKIKAMGHTQVVGKVLFSQYLYPFEIISLILLVALIGAIILGKKRID